MNPEAWEGRNSMNTCSNKASEESIAIHAKSRCQWSLFNTFEAQTTKIWPIEATGALGTIVVAKAPRRVAKQKCVLEVP